MGNLAEYIARSYVIRDATEEGENTADRVGSAFLNGGDVFTSILLVKSNNGRMMTSRDDAIVAQGNTITFGTGWDMFHGSGYFMAGGNVVVPQTVTVGAASGVVYLDVTDNLFKWASTTELLAEKAIIVAHTKDDAIVEVFANRYMLNGKVCGNGVGSGTDMATVWASLADNGSQQINVSHLRDALGGCTWWGSGMSGGAVTGSLSDVLNITMTGRISINGFVIEYDSENNALRFNGSIYATGSVSALGYQSGGGGGGSSTLADLFDVQLTTPIGDGDVLTYDTALGKWTNGTGGGTGSVTSVGMTTPTGLRVNDGSSATITSSGTFALTIGAGYTIPKSDDVSKGVTAYGWGNHATKGYATQAWVSSQGYTTNAGTVTRVGLSVPTGFSVTGSPVTSSGTLTLRFASGYSLPTTAKQSQWDTAYGWGNHADAGYATQAWVEAKGYATQDWINGNYVSIEFFNRLFRMHGDNDTVIVPNDLDTTIQNIEARFGLWTESFLSALGRNSSGGVGGASTLADLLDVNITNPTVGEGLIYDGNRWVNSPIGGGTGSVESVGLSMPTGFSVTGSPITTSGTLAVGFASGYSLPPTSKQAQWDAAYSWGDHSQEGYATEAWVNAKGYTTNKGTVTSVRMTVPAGLTVTGSPITTSGTLAISLGIGYSIPTTAKQSQWDTAYGWGNHALAGYATQAWVNGKGYATQAWVNGKGYATQSSLTSAVTRIGALEGYFTNGVANQAARLSGSSTYQAWGQTYWQNGTPKSIGSASARANISYAGSVSMGWSLNMEYDDAVHDPSINIKSSKTGTSLSVFMLSNSATSDHSGDHLAIGLGTSSKAQLPIRFFGREFVFNYTTNTMSGGNYSTAEAMRVGYRTLDSREEPAVYVRKHLMIGNGAGDYFPVTYDSTNNALCFSGHIYATGGVSALGFSSTQNGGALINGTLAVQSTATVSGNTSIGGTLSVTGATTLADTLTVGKLATFNKGITVSMQATLAQLRATGTVTGTLSVSGACSFGGRFAIVWNGREYYLNVQEMINNGFLS